ncbi:MAG: ATP-binding cassette domain-containing protein [Acidimicrobiales bacterium]|nr:ATP-binding cassette domain-containing protein [Acidimicrobiales bacterium]MDG1878405.1 ATP-binding cassette domain-containing protein [Acidimicrobiales bacterium]
MKICLPSPDSRLAVVGAEYLAAMASAASPAAAVRLEGLRRTFGDLTAVDGIDLEVQAGEIYGFLGPNGAGKSTVVRMLTTLLAPTGGRAWVGGLDVQQSPDDVRLVIGVALQEAGLDANMTGREILVTQGRLFGLSRAQIDARIAELAPILDMGSLDRLVGTYSGGMARRLDLAAALMHNPSVLFLDEPTTGLDPTGRLRVWEEVRRLNREAGLTLFLTTQYLEEADELADRVGIINEGRLVAEGTPTELKRSIGTDVVTAVVEGDPEVAKRVLDGVAGLDAVDVFDDEIRVSTDNGSRALSPVALALAGAGVQVRELSLRTPTLDDVFLDVTGTHLEGGSA